MGYLHLKCWNKRLHNLILCITWFHWIEHWAWDKKVVVASLSLMSCVVWDKSPSNLESLAWEGRSRRRNWYFWIKSFIKCLCMLNHISHVQLFVTLWIVAYQAPLSLGFSGQEDWSGLPWPPSGDLPNPGVEPMSLMSPALAVRFFTTSATCEAPPKCDKYSQMLYISLTILFRIILPTPWPVTFSSFYK